jgi:hypothetical protein
LTNPLWIFYYFSYDGRGKHYRFTVVISQTSMNISNNLYFLWNPLTVRWRVAVFFSDPYFFRFSISIMYLSSEVLGRSRSKTL